MIFIDINQGATNGNDRNIIQGRRHISSNLCRFRQMMLLGVFYQQGFQQGGSSGS
jgi:hypothetical protein